MSAPQTITTNYTTPDFSTGYLSGLEEALRLLGLNQEIDYGTGQIMARIKELKGETMKSEPCDECGVDTIALLDERDKLKSKLQQVEAQAECWKDAVASLQERYCATGDASCYCPACTIVKSAKSDCGTSTLARLEEARWLLENIADYTAGPFARSGWIMRRDALISGHTPAETDGSKLVRMMPKITDPVLLDAIEECGQRAQDPTDTDHENTVDEQWLDSIAAHWKHLTGNDWETKDGECREEGVQANVSAIFQYIEEIKADTDRLIHMAKVQQIETDTFSLRIGMAAGPDGAPEKDPVGVLRREVDADMERRKTNG